jgi:hypothetical protein
MGQATSLAIGVVAAAGLTACGSDSGTEPSAATTSSSTPTSSASASAPASSNGTRIRLRFGDTTMTGHLFDNATANDLASRLAMTLKFSDLNGVEKIGTLPRKLSLNGMPKGDDPKVADMATGRRTATWCSTTATSATGTASCGSAASTATCRPSPRSTAAGRVAEGHDHELHAPRGPHGRLRHSHRRARRVRRRPAPLQAPAPTAAQTLTTPRSADRSAGAAAPAGQRARHRPRPGAGR